MAYFPAQINVHAEEPVVPVDQHKGNQNVVLYNAWYWKDFGEQ